MHKILKIILWAVLAIVIILTALLFRGFYVLDLEKKTADTIKHIENQKIKLADVLGTNLPPAPDKAINDSTVRGIDFNNNGVRDDVELAIFEKYPNSQKIRAGMLQYALALQLELTEVFNSETLVKVTQKEGLAYKCLSEADNHININIDRDVDALVLNTDLRKSKQDEILDKYMTSYTLLNDESCDINLSTLK